MLPKYHKVQILCYHKDLAEIFKTLRMLTWADVFLHKCLKKKKKTLLKASLD